MHHKLIILFIQLRKSLFLSVLLTLMLSCEKDGGQVDDSFMVRHGGAELPVYVHGNVDSKVFILVIHGAGSFGLAFRDGAFTSRLEQDYVVVYTDQRGQSMAQGFYEQPEELIELMADDVMAIARTIKYKYGDDISLFLVGHSLGGMIGTELLLKDNQQDFFKGWVSLDGAHDFPMARDTRRALIADIAEERENSGGDNTEEWNMIKEEVADLDSTKSTYYSEVFAYAKKVTGLLYKEGIVERGISGEKVYRSVIANNPVNWFVSNFFNQPVENALQRNYTLSDHLYKLELPVLLIYGKYDMSVPPKLGKSAYELLGSDKKRLVIFENSLHHPQDSEPDKLADELNIFIENNK